MKFFVITMEGGTRFGIFGSDASRMNLWLRKGAPPKAIFTFYENRMAIMGTKICAVHEISRSAFLRGKKANTFRALADPPKEEKPPKDETVKFVEDQIPDVIPQVNVVVGDTTEVGVNKQGKAVAHADFLKIFNDSGMDEEAFAMALGVRPAEVRMARKEGRFSPDLETAIRDKFPAPTK